MNERIKQLARECGIDVNPTLPGGWPNEQVAVVEAFAELIVRDCIDILEYRNNHSVVVNSIKEIKEHFGVEL